MCGLMGGQDRGENAPQDLLPRMARASGPDSSGGPITLSAATRQGYCGPGLSLDLPAGPYEILIRARVRAHADHVRAAREPVLGIEIVQTDPLRLIWRDFTAGELDNPRLAFVVTAEPCGRVVVKLFAFANADLTIEGLDLCPGSAPDRQPSRYRLLSRMIAKSGALWSNMGALTVSHRLRLGCVLSGPPGFLLPPGCYRLTIAGASKARRPGALVLGIEVTVGTIQRTFRDFTAGDLNAGSVGIAFSVGDEAGLQLVGFELHHFGTCDLTLESVVLTEAAQDEQSIWHLAQRMRAPWSFLDDRMDRWRNVRPRLRVACGKYRFRVRAHSTTPRSDAAVSIELSAQDTWVPPSWLRPLFQALGLRRRRDVAVLDSYDVPVPPSGPMPHERDIEIARQWSGDGHHVGLNVKAIRSRPGIVIDGIDLVRIGEAEYRPVAVSRPAGRRRTRLVVFGNCQADLLAQVFRSELSESFSIVYQSQAIRPQETDIFRRELEAADLLLAQEISDWNESPFAAAVNPKAQVLTFPVLRFASLWPFDASNGPGDSKADAIARLWPGHRFAYHDGLLAKLRKEIPDPEQRLACYASLATRLAADPVRLHNFESRRLAAMDRRHDTTVGAHVLEAFTKRRVFHTTGHPTRETFELLLQGLDKKLGLTSLARGSARIDESFGHIQVPIHPLIAQRLGVHWIEPATLYRFDSRQVSWETYVREYIREFG